MPESTILRFIQILPNVSIEGDFILKDLPGSGKRIDVLCRVLAACFDWAPNLLEKSNIEVIAVIGDSVILRLENPGELLPKGEKAWAKVIKESLQGTVPEYVHIAHGTLESVILEYTKSTNANLWVLHEDGEQVNLQEVAKSTTDNSFMLGDHRGFNSQTEELVSRYTLKKISLGKTSYLSSHCVALIISEFERKDK
jgi:tRNA (pseudouridine54-N1)-methyltransferase